MCDGVVLEDALSEATSGGDSDAELGVVVAAEYPSMLSIGLALLRDPDDAAELAQETMLRLQQQWDRVGRFDRPGAWCRRVALNLAADMLRDRRRRRRLADRLSRSSPDGSVVGEPRGWDDRFWAHVAGLPERQRGVVVLRYVHDLSVAEIAGTLGVPVGTIKSDLARARQQLRSSMEGDDQ